MLEEIETQEVILEEKEKRHFSRKFLISTSVLVISAVGLFKGVLDSGSWVAVSTLICGLYAAGNVMEKKVSKE